MKIRMREMVSYPVSEYGFWVRYDFAYRDPASGWIMQVGADVVTTHDDPDERDRCQVEPARAVIERLLKRKCGVKLAIANQIHLKLPVYGVGRYV